MPHVSSAGGDDLGSTDEVKVFKDEGDGEDEKRSSENLTEEKSSLIDLTESEVHTSLFPSLRLPYLSQCNSFAYTLTTKRKTYKFKIYFAFMFSPGCHPSTITGF